MTIFNVYRIRPQDDGSIKRELAARFVQGEEEFLFLEDVFGMLTGLPEGAITNRTREVLASLRRASYLQVVPADDIDTV
jgi:hypothetical protein